MSTFGKKNLSGETCQDPRFTENQSRVGPPGGARSGVS